jgi:hypothetical protein
VVAVTGTAAGSILAELADTMIAQASEHTHGAPGLITVVGLVAALGWLVMEFLIREGRLADGPAGRSAGLSLQPLEAALKTMNPWHVAHHRD